MNTPIPVFHEISVITIESNGHTGGYDLTVEGLNHQLLEIKWTTVDPDDIGDAVALINKIRTRSTASNL
jgi:hypothetical protein